MRHGQAGWSKSEDKKISMREANRRHVEIAQRST
jgi:hypothetical protein